MLSIIYSRKLPPQDSKNPLASRQKSISILEKLKKGVNAALGMISSVQGNLEAISRPASRTFIPNITSGIVNKYQSSTKKALDEITPLAA